MNPSDASIRLVCTISLPFSHFSLRNSRTLNETLRRSFPRQRVAIFIRQGCWRILQSPLKLLNAFSGTLKFKAVRKLIKEFIGDCDGRGQRMKGWALEGE